ncbi:MAG TPA: hypothetical protein VG871_02305 [Vicinamibacterales bacterium]|nr:hypothetical protein [Vicinamibacterales bacterium]
MARWIPAVVLTCAVLAPMPARAADIDSCKYLLVSDITPDPYGVASELRTEAESAGFIVVRSASQVPDADQFRSCIMAAQWLTLSSVTGQLAVRVVDAASGAPIASATLSSVNWFGMGRTARAAVADVFRQIGYTGYKESVYQERIRRLYPPRPTVAITEDQVRETTPTDPIEGIWDDGSGQYRLAIVPEPGGEQGRYVAVVVKVSAPLWTTGEIKAEFSKTAAAGEFAGNYYALNKQPLQTMFVLQGDVMTATMSTPTGPLDVSLRRVWPEARPATAAVTAP